MGIAVHEVVKRQAELAEQDRVVLLRRANTAIASSSSVAAVTFAALSFSGELNSATQTLGASRFVVLASLALSAIAFLLALRALIPSGVARADHDTLRQLVQDRSDIQTKEDAVVLLNQFLVADHENELRSDDVTVSLFVQFLAVLLLVVATGMAIA